MHILGSRSYRSELSFPKLLYIPSKHVRSTNSNARNILQVKFEHEVVFNAIEKAMNR